jgi:serine/threonine-protein kinase RsbW
MPERIFRARLDQLDAVQRFIREQLQPYPCSDRARFQLEVAVEEIFVNIARYAYAPGQDARAAVCCSVEGSPAQAVVRFSDHGIPFNPLSRPEADITLPAEKRKIGGLGIFMVIKSMDSVSYDYENGENILTIRKLLQEPLSPERAE